MVATTKYLSRAILASWFIIASGCNNLSQDTQPTDLVTKQTQNEVIDLDRSQLIASQLPLSIDRRPVRMIMCWTGDYANDPLGRAPWWAVGDDIRAVESLKRKLTNHYRQGYRRFMFNLPAGYPRQRLMPSSQWLTMPEQRREALIEMLPQWKHDHPETEIYVYAGFNVADPTSLRMSEPIVVPDIDHDWAWFAANWRQWIEDCDLDGIGFDYAGLGPNRGAFVKIARAFSISGIKCIGEAIPQVRNDAGLVLAEEVTQAPWFALDQFIHQHGPEWNFDPRLTECGVGLRTSMRVVGQTDRIPVTEEMILDWTERGLIPYVYSGMWDELVMEIECNRMALDVDTGGVG